MSFTTIQMAETFPEPDILEAFDKLEEHSIHGFAELVYNSYHRGRRQQMIRCIVQYMYHESKSYADAMRVFDYPLIQNEKLHEAVISYYATYAAMMSRSK